MIKAYMDESGTHENSEVISVGAIFGRPVDWAIWTKRWDKAKGSVKAFHAVDLHNGGGEFREWSYDKRKDFVVRMLPILGRSKFLGVAAGIHMNEFRSHMNGRTDLLEIFPTPYSTCVQWVVSGVCKRILQYSDENEIDFIHEKNDYEVEAQEAFRFVQNNYHGSKVKMTLKFDTKSKSPLQAADIIAYESNRMLRDPKAETRKPWLAIDPQQNKYDVVHYGRENMPHLIKTLEKIKAMSPEELRNKAEDTFRKTS